MRENKENILSHLFFKTLTFIKYIIYIKNYKCNTW